jgi:hypothetical protein
MWSLGIVEAMLFVFRVEMWTSRLEVCPFALGILMNMDGVLPGRHIMQVQLDLDTFAGTLDTGSTHVSCAPIFHVDFNRARKKCERKQKQNHNGQNDAMASHAANYTDKRYARTRRQCSAGAPAGLSSKDTVGDGGALAAGRGRPRNTIAR